MSKYCSMCLFVVLSMWSFLACDPPTDEQPCAGGLPVQIPIAEGSTIGVITSTEVVGWHDVCVEAFAASIIVEYETAPGHWIVLDEDVGRDPCVTARGTQNPDILPDHPLRLTVSVDDLRTGNGVTILRLKTSAATYPVFEEAVQ